MEKHVYAVFLSDLVLFIKLSYLVKSVNLAFTHVLFRSVYNDDTASKVKVTSRNCLRSF